MKQPTNETQFKFGEKDIIFREYFDNDFASIETKPTQSLGIILNDKNEVLLVSADNEWWGLPGGTLEKDETPEQTLVREVYEETAVVIDENDITPFFYVITFEIKDGKEIYESTQLRLQQFRKFVPIDSIDKELSWTGTRDIIKRELKKKFNL
jgi:8-oxo-dGTP pyrophosphatase MutT (NUDIX family)